MYNHHIILSVKPSNPLLQIDRTAAKLVNTSIVAVLRDGDLRKRSVGLSICLRWSSTIFVNPRNFSNGQCYRHSIAVQSGVRPTVDRKAA